MAGDGAFLHGAVSCRPGSRWAPTCVWRRTRTDDGGHESPQHRVVPDAGRLYARFAFGDAFSLYLEGGVRGEARPVDGFGAPAADHSTASADRFISREHYLMWRPSATGPYARIGRFYAPYGIRFVEHIFFVRRYTGYELYNETYTASGGYVADEWELHAVGVHAAADRASPTRCSRSARGNRAAPRTSSTA